jgi:hypothetical protein
MSVVNVTKREIGLALLVAAISAIATFMLLHRYLSIETAILISMSIASATGAIVSIERGGALGQVVGFIVLLLMLFFVSPYLTKESIVILTPGAQITLDALTIPLILIAVIGLAFLIHVIGGSAIRFGLWLIAVVLILSWLTEPSATARILIGSLIAVITFMPIAEIKPEYSRLYSLLAVPVASGVSGKTLLIDVTDINVYMGYLLFVLTFIALDPLNKVSRKARALAALVVLFIVFTQMLSSILGAT